MDFINRLESFRGLKDVKFIVYRLMWQYRLCRVNKELFSVLKWNDEFVSWFDKDDCCSIFNYRHYPIYHKKAYIYTHPISRYYLFSYAKDVCGQNVNLPKNY